MTAILMEELLNKPLWAEKAQKKMKQLGITQSDIKDFIGLETTGAIGHWFNGRRSPTLKNLELLAKKLEMSIPELFESEEELKPLKGSEKNLNDALMLLCRAMSVEEERRVVFFSVLKELGVNNIIKATSELSEAEKTKDKYAETVINILDYTKKIG